MPLCSPLPREKGFVSQPQVHRITNAQTSFLEEQKGRTRRYLFSMSLRTICFIAAVVTTGNLRIGFIIGAIFLPYIAVVVANAGRERTFLNIKSPELNLNPNVRAIESNPDAQR
jgi:hypothetical protein